MESETLETQAVPEFADPDLKTEAVEGFASPEEKNNELVESESEKTEVSDSASPIDVGASENERNWQELRKKADAQEALIKELMSAVVSTSSQQPSSQEQEEDYLESIDENTPIYKDDLQKIIRQERAKSSKETLQAVRIEQDKSRFHDKLRHKFSDFDSVVNKQTLQMLEEKDPESAEVIASLGDNYKMGVQSYHLIKSLGLAPKKAVPAKKAQIEKALLDNESNTPSPQAHSVRPMVDVFNVTSDLVEELRNEMDSFSPFHMSARDLKDL